MPSEFQGPAETFQRRGGRDPAELSETVSSSRTAKLGLCLYSGQNGNRRELDAGVSGDRNRCTVPPFFALDELVDPSQLIPFEEGFFVSEKSREMSPARSSGGHQLNPEIGVFHNMDTKKCRVPCRVICGDTLS